MFPSRNPYGFPSPNSCGGPGPEAAFARTVMVTPGSSRQTRGQSHMTNSRPRPVNPPQGYAAPSGTTIVVQPGEPHHFGTTLDHRDPNIVNPLCRCQNPESHGDAWAFTGNLSWMIDTQGRRMTWKELATRVLQHYGKTHISLDEQHQAYRTILTPAGYRSRMRYWQELRGAVGRGEPITISPHSQNLQFHNADRHVQNHVTEGGLRTVLDGQGGDRPSRDAASSMRYGR